MAHVKRINRKTAYHGRVKWRRPIFPRGCPRSIIGAEELNFRVRDGNGCTLFAIVTSSPAHTGGSLDVLYITTNGRSCQYLFGEIFEMTFSQMIILFVAAVLGGMLNSVAGGGTFITLPALIFTGVLPINANATSTVALWPGSVASTWAYRLELAKQKPVLVIVLGVTSLVGGVLGA